MVARHARHDGAIDAGAAGAEEHQSRHKYCTVVVCAACRFLLPFPRSLQPGKRTADPLLHHQPDPVDPLPQMHGQPDRSSHNDRKNHRRHIFHQYDRTDAHCHGTGPEYHIQIFLESITYLIPGQRAHDSSDSYYQRICNDSDRHTVLSSISISCSNLSSVLFTTFIRKQISVFPLLVHQDRPHPPLTFGGIILLFRQHTLHNFPVK